MRLWLISRAAFNAAAVRRLMRNDMSTENDSELSENASPLSRSVWQAYQAMTESKAKHFAFFRFLDEKYEKYGQPSAEEQAQRNRLLKTHDARVNLFKQRLLELKIADPHAYGVFVRQLSQLAASEKVTRHE